MLSARCNSLKIPFANGIRENKTARPQVKVGLCGLQPVLPFCCTNRRLGDT
jgi:hypothetical protein